MHAVSDPGNISCRSKGGRPIFLGFRVQVLGLNYPTPKLHPLREGSENQAAFHYKKNQWAVHGLWLKHGVGP